jgi:hypothetical protein
MLDTRFDVQALLDARGSTAVITGGKSAFSNLARPYSHIHDRMRASLIQIDESGLVV